MSDRPAEDVEIADAFVSRLSHALRTPVALIMGYAELLRTRDDEEIRREAPARIHEAAAKLADVVDDLVVVLADDAGALVVLAGALEVEPLVAEAVRRAESELAGLRISVETSAVRAIAGDPEHLPRILHNLLLNACRRSPRDGHIRVSVREAAGAAAVSVTDAGEPLGDERARRAFERFRPPDWSLDEPRATGLELYKVRRLVELHGGSTSVRNEPEGGATFAFTIPLAEAVEPV